MRYDLDTTLVSAEDVERMLAPRPRPLYHGGVPGLRPGDLLRPGHSRDDLHPGCPWCEARAAGDTTTVDAPSERHAVYVTEDRSYARYYASLYGRGDLYEVEPIGPLTPSTEDITIPAWTCAEARVVLVVQRAVLLTMRQRWDHYWTWAKREGVTKAQARREFEGMLSGKWREGREGRG